MFLDEKAPGEAGVVVADPATTLLITAKGIIEDAGWCQETFGSPERGYCMVGALCTAYRNMPFGQKWYDDAEDRLLGVIDSGGWDDIPFWNDEPGRTKEEVLAVFDRAIACGW